MPSRHFSSLASRSEMACSICGRLVVGAAAAGLGRQGGQRRLRLLELLGAPGLACFSKSAAFAVHRFAASISPSACWYSSLTLPSRVVQIGISSTCFRRDCSRATNSASDIGFGGAVWPKAVAVTNNHKTTCVKSE